MSLVLPLLAAISLAGFSPDAAHENRPELRARILSQQVQHQTRRLEEAIAWAQRLQHQLHQARAALEEPTPPAATGTPPAATGGPSVGSSWAAGGAPLCSSACVQCESSGNPDAVSDDGIYWGLYQYDLTSWIADGGSAASYGSASASEQAAVAARAPFDRWPNC